MDREISKEVRQKEQRKQFIKLGAGIGIAVVLIGGVIGFMQTSLQRKDLVFSTVDKGVIEVSVSASGKVVPAFEEIINSPINSRIVEIYKKGGDSVDVGTPILKLDLLSAETDYKKQLDEEQMKRLQLDQLRIQNRNKLSEMEMQLKVSRMELNRKEVELRNERYLDSLGAGTTDKVRQVELDYNVSVLKLKEDEQKYENEKSLTDADYKVKARPEHLPKEPSRDEAYLGRRPDTLSPQGDPDLREQRGRCPSLSRQSCRYRLRLVPFQDRGGDRRYLW